MKTLFLHVPAAALAAFLAAFAAFCAFPLSPVGNLFDNQPDYLPGYTEQFLFALVPLYYLVTYGALSAWLRPPLWAKVGLSGGVGVLAAGLAFATVFGGAMSGHSEGLGPTGLPLVLFDKCAYFLTAGLREGHYMRHLDDPDEGRRDIAAGQVYSIVYEGYVQRQRRVPAGVQRPLARALRSADEGVRKACQEGLAMAAPWDRKVNDLVLEALTDPSAAVRADAAGAFAERDHEDDRLVAALVAAAEKDTEPAVRSAAAIALGKIAADDPRFERMLLGAIERGEPLGATLLLTAHQGDPRAVAAFRRFLADRDPRVRRAWIEAIGARDASTGSLALEGPRAPSEGANPGQASLDVRAALRSALPDADPGVREAAVRQLGKLFPEDPDVLLSTADMLKDEVEDVREAAISILLDSGSRDPRVHLAVARAMLDPNEAVRAMATQALAGCGPLGAQARAVLAEIAAHGDADAAGRERELLQQDDE